MGDSTVMTAISTVVSYLAIKLKENSSIQNFFDDFTEATINWIKPIFIREDGIAKDILKDLQGNPDSKAQQGVVKSSIEVAIEKDPHATVFLYEMLKIVLEKNPSAAKGNLTQYHGGSGDNVGGDKTVYYK